MANLQTAALAAVQPTGNNDEIFVWYQKHPGYAAFGRTKLSDALIGIVPFSAAVEEVVADSAAKPEPPAGGGDEEETDVYKPFVSSWSFTKAVIKSTVSINCSSSGLLGLMASYCRCLSLVYVTTTKFV